MLTLSANWQAEFQRADVEPVYLVQVYTSTGTPLCFCTGARIIELSAIVNPFGGSTAGTTAYPSIATVSPLATELDPFERNIQHNSCTITFHDDGAVRDYLQTTRLLHKSVSVDLGSHNLTAEADWAPVFRGIIVSVRFRNGMVDVECMDTFRWTLKPYWGNWANRHPLEAIKKVLEDSGIPEELIDDDSFDPTHADYVDVRHYVSGFWEPTHAGPQLPGSQPAGNAAAYFRKNVHPEPVEIICTHLAKGMVGTLFAQETGVIKFVKFDTGATVRANWTEDDISDFQQLETVIVNEIDVSVTGVWWDHALEGASAKEATVKFGDSTSQSNFAFPGESKGIFTQSTEFNLLDMMARYGAHGTSGFSETGDVEFTVFMPWGLSGTRVTGDFTFPGPWASMQAAGSTIHADRPLYLMLDDEVVKCVSLALQDTGAVTIPEVNTDGTVTYSDKPRYGDITLVNANRGQFGTTKAAHNSSTESDGKVLDLTMAVAFSEKQLQRFSNGVPIVEFTTSLAEWAIQLGDFVTVTHDNYLEFGFDGLDSTTSWEVIGKELRLDDTNAGIRWRLAYATKASPPTIVKTYDWIKRDWIKRPVEMFLDAAESEVGVSRHVVRGLDVTSSGLDVTVGVGRASLGGRVDTLTQAVSQTVVANKDHWFYLSVPGGFVGYETKATGAAMPILGNTDVLLAKVVAGGSTCTITDMREFAAVRPRNLSPLDFEGGQNLIFNPSFETWSLGQSEPPDHWHTTSPIGGGDESVWRVDFARSEDAAHGAFALENSVVGDYMVSSIFPLDPVRTYTISCEAKPNSSGITVLCFLELLTESKANITEWNFFNATSLSTSAFTKKSMHLATHATTQYGRVWLGCSGGSGRTLFDNIRLVRAMPSFFATNATQTITGKNTAALTYSTEVYDYGGNYTTANSTCTIHHAGVWTFTARVGAITNGESGNKIILAKNGSTFLSRTSGSATGFAQLNSGPISLAAGDLITMHFYNDSSSSAVVAASATETWFCGSQVS